MARKKSALAGMIFVLALITLHLSSATPAHALLSQTYYVVQYNQENIATTQERLQEYFQERIKGYIPQHQYIILASTEELAGLQKENLIETYTRYADALTLMPFPPAETEEYLIVFFSPADEDRFLQQMQHLSQDNNMQVRSPTHLQVNIDSPEELQAISAVEGIAFIQPISKMEVMNNQANSISGIPIIQQRFQLFGKNQVIGISDTGLDTGDNDSSMHDDIEGRILELVNKAPRYLTKPWDKNGHGTHVTGSVLGNGILSGSNPPQHQYTQSYAGSAPEASLVFQALGDDQGSLSIYPPYPISVNLFLPAYQKGARFHSNSWGSVGSVFYGVYENTANDIDYFTNQYQDLLVLFAAGNYGYSGRMTVIPPSTNKNGLSVGAVDTSNPSQRAGFSSQGPTIDGRYKPDVVAPGTNIVSTKSSVASWCSSPSNQNYCIMSGTSMATPHLAGVSALVREYYGKFLQYATPSAALIKATIFAGTDTLGKTIPDLEIGWGRMNLTKALPSDGAFLAYWDVAQGLRTGKENNHTIALRQGKPLTVVLVWTDVPGNVLPLNASKLVNDLDLTVTAPDGTRYAGNDVQPPYADQFDHLNNVERVYLASPAAGNYTISVKGYNVPWQQQTYAVVAQFDNALIKVRGVNSVPVCVGC